MISLRVTLIFLCLTLFYCDGEGLVKPREHDSWYYGDAGASSSNSKSSTGFGSFGSGEGSHLGVQIKELSEEEKHLPGAPRFVPVFKEQNYVSPTTPAKLECEADSASYVTIHCNDKVLDKKVEIISDHNRIERQKFWVEISFKDVSQWFGSEFYCNCEAWNRIRDLGNEYRKVVSPKLHVKLSYFDSDRFQFDPLPVNVSLDTSVVTLQCIPPTSVPKSKVRWLKNGEPLDLERNKERMTLDHQAHLIIRPLKLEDIGNYSCIAEIPGQSVKSNPAAFTIFVNGGWNHWGLWDSCPKGCVRDSECPKVCFETKRKRHRKCDSPKPEYGGLTCPGADVESELCDVECIVDGFWTAWSEWTFCGPDCKSSRQRSCNGPKNGGLPCPRVEPFGATQYKNCSDGICKKREDAALLKYFNGNKEEVPTNHLYSVHDIAMYVGLFVAVAVLVTVAVVIVYLVRRKTVSFTAGRRVMRYSVHMNGNSSVSSHEKDGKVAHELLLPPDLTHNVTIKNHNAMDGSVPMVSYKSPLHSEQALRVQLPISSTYQSLGKHGLHNLTPHSLDDKSRPCSGLYHELSLGSQSHVFAGFVPANLNVENMAWGSVGAAGGRLCLPDSGVSLTIPYGAIQNGNSEDFFLAVCRDDRDRPRLSEKQTLLSPVVICGPPNVTLLKHVILSLPHSACLAHGFWNVSVLHSDSSAEEQISWREHFKVGSESVTTPGYCQMDNTVCHLMLEDMGRFCLIGQSLDGGNAVKFLRLAAFAAPLQSSPDFTLRMYILSDTSDAFVTVMQMEEHLGGQLLDSPKQLLYRDGGHSLCFNIEELSLGWRSKAKYQEIPFQHVWSGNQSGILHCSFSLEHVDPTRQSVSCKIVVYQNHFYSNRQVVHIISNKSDLPSLDCNVSHSQHQHQQPHSSNQMGMNMDPIQTGFRLSPQIRKSIGHLMDTPNPRGNDWRMLARQLGVDRYITYFATKSSPTDCILDLWEARHREESALCELISTFKAMNRSDVANILEQDPNAWC